MSQYELELYEEPLKEMSRGYSGSRWLLLQINQPPTDHRICRSCLRTLRRLYATTSAAATSSSELSPPTQQVPPRTASTGLSEAYHIKAGVVLSRPPLLTRDLRPFETAFHFYQKRLNERLALPFTRYFYYQRDTPADVDWKKKMKERLTPARDIGVYNAFKEEGWNDELLVGATESEPDALVEALVKDARVETEEDGPSKKEKLEKPLPRTTEADKAGDVRSLNRALARTLYLVVKGEKDGWGFPSGGLIGKESLQRAAERLLVQAGGVNMNTWIVGHHPVGHHNHKHWRPQVNEEKQIKQIGEKTFFMKARIMAGQANLKDNQLGLLDFKWLAKDELQKELHPQYWNSVKNMLVER